MSLLDVVRHLLVHGPARNDAEREQLLASLDEPPAPPAAPPPDPSPVHTEPEGWPA